MVPEQYQFQTGKIKNIDFYEVNNFEHYWQICKYGPKTIRLQKKD